MDDLKKCPFCGCTAVLDQDDRYPHLYSIRCNGCRVKTEERKTMGEVIERWNHRVFDDGSRKMEEEDVVDALKKLAEKEEEIRDLWYRINVLEVEVLRLESSMPENG